MKAIHLLPFALLAACVDAQDEVDDPIDESFLGEEGKEDAFGIKEGTPDALGILDLVNTADRTTLKEEAGITSTATTKILAHRNGPDGTLGTNDDNLFGTLRELDDVPYVGSGSFARLLTFARENDYVVTPPTPPSGIDPFDPASCAGPLMTQARLQQITGNGLAPMPNAAVYHRTRICNGSLGCGPWSVTERLAEPAKITYKPEAQYVDFLSAYERTETIPDPHYGSYTKKTEYKSAFRQWATVTGSSPMTPSLWRVTTHSTGHLETRYFSNVTATMTTNCSRVFGRIPATSPGQTEVELVVFQTY